MDLRVFQFTPPTRAEGPGLRACIQVQGCTIRCPGCAVPQTWFEEGGQTLDSQLLIAKIADGPTVEGVTFLGGEPFEQAAALAEIARWVKAHGMTVLTFTGYWLEDLQKAKRVDFDELLAATDLLIDGPFQREYVQFTRPWVGSSNQRFHFLTDQYAHLALSLSSIPNRIEVRLNPDGRIFVSGLAPISDMKRLISDFG
jgi:anaerobic ribonucleoside-triphosphate reductase activating protein